MAENFHAIHPSELVDASWMKEKKKEMASPNLLKHTRFETMVFYVFWIHYVCPCVIHTCCLTSRKYVVGVTLAGKRNRLHWKFWGAGDLRFSFNWHHGCESYLHCVHSSVTTFYRRWEVSTILLDCLLLMLPSNLHLCLDWHIPWRYVKTLLWL